MPKALNERQRQLINFISTLIGMVLVLNYEDLADPMNDNSNRAMDSATAWCQDWNTYCGFQRYEDESYVLFCAEPSTILDNSTLPEALNAFIIEKDDNDMWLCGSFVDDFEKIQDDYEQATNCEFDTLGETLSGLFILAQLTVGLIVWMPSLKPSHDDGTVIGDTDIDPGCWGTARALLCGGVDRATHEILKGRTKRLMFLLLSSAECIFCLGYTILLFYYFECYDSKRMFHWFFMCLFCVCFVNSSMLAIRSYREHRLKIQKAKLKAESNAAL